MKMILNLLCLTALLSLGLPSYGQKCLSGNCENGSAVLEYADGNRYVGAVKAGQPSGLGAILYANGDIQYGSFSNGKADGQGFKYKHDGFCYVGTWKAGHATGEFHQFTEESDMYVGPYLNDRREGEGVLAYHTGGQLAGSFKLNEFTGKGSWFVDGEVQRGNWEDWACVEGCDWYAAPQGGPLKWVIKDLSAEMKYIGEYDHDKANGWGTMILTNGRILRGKWVNQTLTGPGLIIVTDHYLYMGELKGNKPEGKGMLYSYENGNLFVGDFQQGNPWGQVLIGFSNGDLHDGQMVNGERHGPGTFYGIDGEKAVGEWVKGEYQE